MSSHAALVARGFGKPCVSGCESIDVDEESKSFSINGVRVGEGQVHGSIAYGRITVRARLTTKASWRSRKSETTSTNASGRSVAMA